MRRDTRSRKEGQFVVVIESLSFEFIRETANAGQRKKVNIGGKEQITRKYCQQISTLPLAVAREREA